MAKTTIFPGGSKEVLVTYGNKVFITNFGDGQAVISYLSPPGNVPQKWDEQQRIENESVLLGTFSADQWVRIEALNSTVQYEIGTNPVGNIIENVNDEEIVINENGASINIRFESSVNENTFYIKGSDGNIGYNSMIPDSWYSGMNVFDFGDSFAIVSEPTSKVQLHVNSYNTTTATSKYKDDGTAVMYQLGISSGLHLFRVASTGIANDNISWIETLRMTEDAITFNEGSKDIDVRWESDSKVNGFVLDAGTSNIGIGIVTYGGGTGGVIAIANATAPSSNATGGGILYSEAGALKWRGSGGTITTLGAA